VAHYDAGYHYDSGIRYSDGGSAPTSRSTMIKLRRLFEVHFRDPEISLNELVAYATDSHQRTIANNPGAAFNAIITATTTALATLGNCTTDDITRLALRKAAKQAKDTFRDALPGNIAKIHGRVVGQYGDPSPQVTQCFPNGRTIFNKCVDDAVDNHLQALINGLTPLAPVMGPETLADAGGLLSTWLGLYAASESTTGAKTTTQAEKAAARAALERQLSINALTIALHFLDQPEMADVYFQQHLLEDHPAGEEEEEPPPPPPPGP